MSSEACTRKVDDFKAYCGLPADYEIFGEPCSCTEVYNLKHCQGHVVCEGCVADLRLNARRVHRDREATFTPVRIRTPSQSLTDLSAS